MISLFVLIFVAAVLGLLVAAIGRDTTVEPDEDFPDEEPPIGPEDW